MSSIQLLADAGATKTQWCIIGTDKKRTIYTKGISPYFLSVSDIVQLISEELKPKIKNLQIDAIHYYGTGCIIPEKAKMVKEALTKSFGIKNISVTHDLEGTAKSLFGDKKGIACILGTGSSACFYNGKKVGKAIPGLGYILGDEGSGAYLGRKVVQYYLYKTFDADLMAAFDDKFKETKESILQKVYKEPLANRYLAGFTHFLAENRGHYMVENIIEDGLNEFFFSSLCKFNEAWKYPIGFTGGVAFGFKDVIKELCYAYSFELGAILKEPMAGLINYHREK